MKALLLIYTLGTLTDYWTTVWALARGATEKNPFLAWLITEHGAGAFLYFKIGAIVFTCLVVRAVLRGDELIAEAINEPYRAGRKIAFAIIWFMALGQWLIVANNFFQMRIAMAMGM